MKLIYIANLRLPTEKAHGVQIMQMCHATAHPHDQRSKIQNQKFGIDDVVLVVPFRWRTSGLRGVKDIFAYYGVERSFHIIRLPSLDLFPLARIFPFLDRVAFALQYGTFLVSLGVFLAIRYTLKATSPIVYTRDSRIVRLALWFSKRVFLELHTIPRADDISAAKSAIGVVTVTHKLKEMLVEGGVAEGNILVAPDGVDLEAFDRITDTAEVLRKRLGLPLDAKLIGYMGRLKTMDTEKGIPDLLEAFAKLQQTDAHARLIIVGGGAGDAAAYHDTMRMRYIVSKVHYVSHVAPTDAPYYLRAMDVLVAPFPRTDHYAYAMSPLKIFEYMASGCPMVASDLPSLREILSGDDTCFFEPGNVDELARAIASALRNTDESKRKAANARRKVEQYTWEKRAERILKFMQNAETLNPKNSKL